MTRNPREILSELMSGMGAAGKTNPEIMSAFMNFAGVAAKGGAIDEKVKELISVGVSVYSRCEYCIVLHVYNALKIGATPQEIMEAALVTGAFGGGPAIAYTTTLVQQCIDEFSKDF